MKIIGEKETQKKQNNNNNNNNNRRKQGGTEPVVNGWKLNDFVVHLSFL